MSDAIAAMDRVAQETFAWFAGPGRGRLHEHESLDELLGQLRQAHARLMQAARRSPNLDVACFRRANGETMTGRQRLELLARHWTEHVDELKKAGAAR